MSIKAVDFQVMMPKTPEVSKIHSDEHQRNQTAAQQQAVTVQHQAESETRQVHSQDKAHGTQIREKQQKERGERRQQKKNNKGNYGNSGTSKKSDSEEQESFIDIRL